MLLSAVTAAAITQLANGEGRAAAGSPDEEASCFLPRGAKLTHMRPYQMDTGEQQQLLNASHVPNQGTRGIFQVARNAALKAGPYNSQGVPQHNVPLNYLQPIPGT